MSEQIEMPKYKCHKEVAALKIKWIGTEQANGSVNLTPENEDYAMFAVDKDFVEKHKPHAGGYYVAYKDGYKSFSPAKAFEGGYKTLELLADELAEKETAEKVLTAEHFLACAFACEDFGHEDGEGSHYWMVCSSLYDDETVTIAKGEEAWPMNQQDAELIAEALVHYFKPHLTNL